MTPARSLTRRELLAGAVATVAGAGAINAFAIQPNRVTVSRHRVGDASAAPVRIVQLTDLHLREVGRHERRIAETVVGLRPDLVVLTGDSVDQRRRLPELAEFLALLPSPAAGLAILGNWEHWGDVDLRALRATYERHGIRLLRNESTELRFAHGTLLVTGLDDLVGGRPDVRAALRGVAPRPDHLLLAHCPAHREIFARGVRVAALGAPESPDQPRVAPNLMLSGHTHGGQIQLGGWAPFRPPGSGRYVSGWYRDAGTQLYVSRGLGTSVLPARVGAPPEIAVFDWSLRPE